MAWIQPPYAEKRLNATLVAHVALLEGADPRAVDVYDYRDRATYEHSYHVSTRRGPRVEWVAMSYDEAFDLAWDLAKEANAWNADERTFNGVAWGVWPDNWKKPGRRGVA